MLIVRAPNLKKYNGLDAIGPPDLTHATVWAPWGYQTLQIHWSGRHGGEGAPNLTNTMVSTPWGHQTLQIQWSGRHGGPCPFQCLCPSSPPCPMHYGLNFAVSFLACLCPSSSPCPSHYGSPRPPPYASYPGPAWRPLAPPGLPWLPVPPYPAYNKMRVCASEAQNC